MFEIEISKSIESILLTFLGLISITCIFTGIKIFFTPNSIYKKKSKTVLFVNKKTKVLQVSQVCSEEDVDKVLI